MPGEPQVSSSEDRDAETHPATPSQLQAQPDRLTQSPPGLLSWGGPGGSLPHRVIEKRDDIQLVVYGALEGDHVPPPPALAPGLPGIRSRPEHRLEGC